MSLSRIKDKDDQDGHSQIRRERVGSGWDHHAVSRKQRLYQRGSRRQGRKGYGGGVGGTKRQWKVPRAAGKWGWDAICISVPRNTNCNPNPECCCTCSFCFLM